MLEELGDTVASRLEEGGGLVARVLEDVGGGGASPAGEK